MCAAALLLLSASAAVLAQQQYNSISNYYFVAVGTFEHRCLAMNEQSAYVNGKCIVAYQDDQASDAEECTKKEFSGITGRAFKYDSKADGLEVERQRIILQSGYYHVSRSSAQGRSLVPSSGKKGTAVGYICEFGDPQGCVNDWMRFRDRCYRPMNKKATFVDAVKECYNNGESSVAHVEDDDANRFLAELAADKFNSTDTQFWANAEFKEIGKPWSYNDGAGKPAAPVEYFRWWFGKDAIKLKSGDYPVINFGRDTCDKGAMFGYWQMIAGTQTKHFFCDAKISTKVQQAN